MNRGRKAVKEPIGTDNGSPDAKEGLWAQGDLETDRERAKRARRAALGGLLGGLGDSPAEALAVLMGSGRNDDSAGAARLLHGRSAARLAKLGAGELVGLHGCSPAAARRIAAAFRLGREVHRERLAQRPLVAGPSEAADLLHPCLAGLEQEVFVALCLDAKHRLNRAVRISQGTLTSSLVHPREVFRVAVREGAAALLVAHNHPSGDPTPSAEDLVVTRRLFEAGKLLGVPLLDHVVLGAGRHVSIRSSAGMPPR